MNGRHGTLKVSTSDFQLVPETLDVIRLGPPPNEDSESILVTGDFAMSPQSAGKRDAVVAPPLDTVISESTCAIANFEGAIETPSPPVEKFGPHIAIDSSAPTRLSAWGFDAVTLANNHSIDFGSPGLSETISACEQAGLWTVGAGSTVDSASNPSYFEAGDTKVAVLNASETITRHYYRDFSPTIAEISHPRFISNISQASSHADVVIVIAHTGIPGTPLPPVQLQSRFRQFIDHGADVVIGHHPHVPQGWERYDGKFILYSLGDFLFQTNTPDFGNKSWGLVATMYLTGDAVTTVELLPVETRGPPVEPVTTGPRAHDVRVYLKQSTDIIADADQLAAYWSVIATEITGDKTIGLSDNPELFLYYLQWESNRWALETGLRQVISDDIPPESVRSEALELWTFTRQKPHLNRSERLVKSTLYRLYSPTIKSLFKRLRLHQSAVRLYEAIFNRL